MPREAAVKAELKAPSGSVTGKVLFIAFLILVLLIPLGMIEGVAIERSQLYEAARADIARSWGQAQTIGGPILVVPFTYTRDTLVNYARDVDTETRNP
jgi:inner membrane protein